MDRNIHNRNSCAAQQQFPHFGVDASDRARVGVQYQEDLVIKPGPCDSFLYSDTSNSNPARWPYRENRSETDMTPACKRCIISAGDMDCPCSWDDSFDKYKVCVSKAYGEDKQNKKLHEISRRCAGVYHAIYDDCPNITDPPFRSPCDLDRPRQMPDPY